MMSTAPVEKLDIHITVIEESGLSLIISWRGSGNNPVGGRREVASQQNRAVMQSMWV
jgi:hypothetical protein